MNIHPLVYARFVVCLCVYNNCLDRMSTSQITDERFIGYGKLYFSEAFVTLFVVVVVLLVAIYFAKQK